MKINKPFLISISLLVCVQANAKLNVITTVTDLKSLVELVGKENVEVQSIAKGTQDAHFIDAKPSYMTKMAHADLVVAIGLGLEDAWLNNVLKGARNPKVNRGNAGFLAIGPSLDPDEIPEGTAVSRSEGDVHPEGNPHVTVDPVRMAKAAELIGAKLAELNPAHKDQYTMNAKDLAAKLNSKAEECKKRIAKIGLKNVVTYHKTLDYFWKRMGVTLATVLEPKPGIEPSVSHLNEVIGVMKSKNAHVVIIENYFNPDVANKLKELNPLVKVAVVPVAVEGDDKVKSSIDLYESLTSTLEKLQR